MKKITIDALSREERVAIEKSMLTEGTFALMAALVEYLGSQGTVNVLRPHARMSGHAFAINMLNMFGIEGSDIERIADVTELYDEFMGGSAGGSIDIERSTDKIIRTSPNCPYKAGLKESCIWGHEMTLNGICEAINPEYECRFLQMITKGDPMCSYIIENKKK